MRRWWPVTLLVLAMGCSISHHEAVRTVRVSGAVASPAATLTTAAPRPTTSPETPAVSGLQVCRSSQLTVVPGDVQGAAGTAISTIALTNRSSVTCVLRGFPAVRFLDAARRVMPATNQHGGSTAGLPTTAHWTVVEPGTRVWFTVAMLDNDHGRLCPESASITVIPPGETQPLVAAMSAPVCGFTVNVSPVRSAQRLPD